MNNPFEKKSALDKVADRFIKNVTDETTLGDVKQSMDNTSMLLRQLIQILSPDSSFETILPIQKLANTIGNSANNVLVAAQEGYTISVNMMLYTIESTLASVETTSIYTGGNKFAPVGQRNICHLIASQQQPMHTIVFPEPFVLFPDESLKYDQTGGLGVSIGWLFVLGRYRSTKNIDYRQLER